MNSMTGHGRGDSAGGGYQVIVEISSVNRRQSELTVSLPRELEALETRIRDVIRQKLARGRLTVRVSCHAGERAVGSRVRLNAPLARAYARELRKLARDMGLEGSLTLDTLVRAPGVLQAIDDETQAERIWPQVAQALERAVAAVLRMRRREGAHLARDLAQRVRLMRRAVLRIQRRAPAVVTRYRETLRERVASAGLPLPPAEDERLLREVVYFADRSDITEELTRLLSHFQQCDDCLRSPEPVGRTLDFLAQELNREVNTIGSKANDGLIAREVMTLKAEVEKFREQAQNVE